MNLYWESILIIDFVDIEINFGTKGKFQSLERIKQTSCEIEESLTILVFIWKLESGAFKLYFLLSQIS